MASSRAAYLAASYQVVASYRAIASYRVASYQVVASYQATAYLAASFQVINTYRVIASYRATSIVVASTFAAAFVITEPSVTIGLLSTIVEPSVVVGLAIKLPRLASRPTAVPSTVVASERLEPALAPSDSMHAVAFAVAVTGRPSDSERPVRWRR